MEKAGDKLELIYKYFSEFDERQSDQLAALYELYRSWNEKINVISRKDIESLYEKHILHSLAIAAIFEFEPGTQVIDIGTGGGFPGIPLAIFFPEVQFHLSDSIGKKIKVVNEVASAIELKNISTQQIRAEEIKSRKFDFAISRAVAPVKELWKWSKPLLKAKGQGHKAQVQNNTFYSGLICLKGGDLAAEITESRLHPYVWEINSFFEEEFFREKFVLFFPL